MKSDNHGGSYSYHFSGSSDDFFSVDLGTDNWGEDSDFSFAVWVKRDTGATDNVVFSTGDVGEYSLQVYNDATKWYLSSKTAGGSDTTYEIGTVVDDTWQHIAVTYDYSTQILNTYLGNIETENTGVTTMGGFYGYRIGASRNEDTLFDGYIDNLLIYDTVLTASEVSNIYNYGNKDVNNFSQYVRNKVQEELVDLEINMLDKIVSSSYC